MEQKEGKRLHEDLSKEEEEYAEKKTKVEKEKMQMATEESVGISCYLTNTKGFTGIFKSKY